MGTADWLVGRDWADTLEWLPGNLDALLAESGTLQRRRSVRCGEELVRLGLAYSLLDLSLRSTAAWWTSIGQPSMSDVVVLKRLKSATPFLGKVLYAMLSRATAGPAIANAGLRVRLIDATSISEPGSEGTDWRLHVCYDPARAAIDHVEITDVHGGEHLERAAAQAGDLILGDRAYAGPEKICALAAAGAHTLVRIGHSAVRLFDEGGDLWDLLAFATRRRPTQGRPPRIEARDVWLHSTQGPPLQARLVVVRKSREGAEYERARILAEAKRKGKEPGRRTLEAAAFTFLLTTLPQRRIADEDIADLYRMRWQV